MRRNGGKHNAHSKVEKDGGGKYVASDLTFVGSTITKWKLSFGPTSKFISLQYPLEHGSFFSPPPTTPRYGLFERDMA